MSVVRRFLTAVAFFVVVLAGVVRAQDPYKYTPRIVYVIGQPGWDQLSPGENGAKQLRVFATIDEAQAAAGGREIFRIKRHDLLDTKDGTEWLSRLQANPKEFLSTEIPFSNQAAFETLIHRSRTGSDLGPKNPDWITEGRYSVTKPMGSEYLPGQLHDDYAAGTFYLKTEGPEAAFLKDFRVKFEKGPDGGMRALFNNGTPIDTKSLTSDVKGKCLWVMDAAGNFYVIALEWAPIGPMGYRMINHSSIPSGHPVAGAGQIEIHDGKIISIDNNSGHYAPSNKMLVQAVDALQQKGVAKGAYKVSWSVFAGDSPGDDYLALDPEGKQKVEEGKIAKDPNAKQENSKLGDGKEGTKPGDEQEVLKPEEKTPTPELEVDRKARESAPETPKLEAPKPEPPPDPSVIEALTKAIKDKPLDQMDIEFMKQLYRSDPKASKAIRQILAKSEFQAQNLKMGELRKTMDLMVWREVLINHPGLSVEITNQGKSNGARSDLDYTLYHIAKELGVPIEKLIEEHGSTWKSVHEGLSPNQFEITVMNGDHFYPDWRTEHLTAAQYEVELLRLLGELRANPEAYSTPGAFKQQVFNRALREGYTEVLQYDPAKDQPGAKVEETIVKEAGLTRDLAARYKEVHPLYNHMFALGNAIQNTREFIRHTGNEGEDAVRRAKYLNRVINEGLGGLKFFANDYASIHAGKVVYRNPRTKGNEEMKLEYLRKTLGLLADDNGKPLLDEAQLKQFRDIIDISMQIELDKTGKTPKEFDTQRKEYFKNYAEKAERTISERVQKDKLQPDPKEYGAMVLSEQQRLFEIDQKKVMAEATLAALRQSVARDLTPEGVLRNRVRWDPATQKFVINDPEGAKKVAFERAVEVALFYELVNSLNDEVPEEMFLKRDMKKRALATAPNQDLAEFYGTLDQVGQAEIDRLVKGETGNKVKAAIDELTKKQQLKALELLIERKEAAVTAARAKGVSVDPNAIAEGVVQEHFVTKQLDRLMGPENRREFYEAIRLVRPQLAHDFKKAWDEHGSVFMLGSSAVNLARAYQSGCKDWVPNPLSPEGQACIKVLTRTAFTESLFYMPSYIQMPFMAVDLVAKIREGQYFEAAKSGGLLVAMHKFPDLGWGLLVFNMVSGTMDLTRTYFVTRIDADMTEKALRSRPVDKTGARLPENVRARFNPFPDFTTRVGKGSAPWTPLFFGKYKNEVGLARNPVIINGMKYSDGTVPEDFMSDEELADSAGVLFAPEILRELAEANLEVNSPEWRIKVWNLKLKYGFDVPFYKRMAKVYDEKYQYVQWIDGWPNPYNEDYLHHCREDVYEWYVGQPQGYKDELAGDFTFFYGDQTDKMQELIAKQCAVVMGSIHEMRAHAGDLNKENLLAFNTAMSKGFNAERALLAAKGGLTGTIQTREQRAAEELEQKALQLAEKHKTQFVMSYPFTFATEELPPTFDFEVRTIPSHAKQPFKGIDIEQEILGAKEGAPPGWKPGSKYEADFKPDQNGKIRLRPITADVKFTAHLRDADSNEVATTSLTLPIVRYANTFGGSVVVVVYGLGEKGDSTLYGAAEVTMDKDTRYAGTVDEPHSVSFDGLKAGSYSVTVKPRKADERHGPGSGSATLEDPFLSKDPKAPGWVRIVVKLPYIPEKKDIANKTDSSKAGGNTGGTGTEKPGTKKDDKTGTTGGTGGGKDDKTGTGGKDDKTGTGGGKGGKDPTGGGPNVDDIIKGLAPLTSKAEKARDDAKKSCQYIQAAAAQQELVTAANDFVAKSFPNGAPANIQQMVNEFEAELTTLKKTAKAQEDANVFLREGLAAIRSKHAEPALDALEKASKVDGIPQCLYDQVMKTYNDLKADVEKRMKLIDKAVEAANDKCDYAAAQTFGEQVEAEDKTLSWVVNELPRIKALNLRQKNARDLASRAEAKAQEADAAAAAGDKARATALYDEALQLAQQALAAAPPCEKENLKGLLDLPARKANMSNPKVDQSLVLLLDTSGSMGSDNKMENAKSAATDAVKSLGPTTEVALISYDGGCAGGWRVVQDFTTNHQSLISAIATLRPGGGTPTAPAIGFAHEYLQKNGHGKAGQIMLMTDGQNDCGSMVDAGNGLRRSSIPVRIDAVGFGLGDGSQAQKDLGDLVRASGGGGGAYSANNAKELISAFRRAFITTQVKQRDPVVTGEAGTRLAALFAAAIEALKAGNMRGAIDQFRGAADQFPASPSAAFNASLAYEAGGQPLQAMNYAKKYLQLAPNAFDAGQVQARIGMLEQEQAANPRAIYSPTDCGELYRWATRESRTPGMDAARKAKVFEILTTAQRGDCAAAKDALDKYNAQYGKKP